MTNSTNSCETPWKFTSQQKMTKKKLNHFTQFLNIYYEFENINLVRKTSNLQIPCLCLYVYVHIRLSIKISNLHNQRMHDGLEKFTQ